MWSARSAAAVSFSWCRSRLAVFGHKMRGQVERILHVFEGKAAAFEALGDQKIVGLSSAKPILSPLTATDLIASARRQERMKSLRALTDVTELVADLEHAFGPGVKLMRGYAVRSGGGINESL